MRLLNGDIENYKLAIGKQITWLGFTSTSKSAEKAKEFKWAYGGNIFITFRLQQRNIWNLSSDIETLSNKEDEKEILLMAGYIFTLNKFEPDPQTGEWEMELTEGYI
jgi:hypothetical protein